MNNYKYKISLISMFKNEEMIIKNWIDHYILEGIEHFYLIDNGSTDNYQNILNNYIDKNLITIIIDKERDKYLTQPLLFNRHFLDKVKKESEWVIVADADEYIYSRKNYKTIVEFLNNVPDHINNITMPWKNFGSNNFINHPKSIIHSFIMSEDIRNFKERIITNMMGHCKTISKTENLIKLNVHCHDTIDPKIYFSDFSLVNNTLSTYDIDNQNLHINHYQHMSYEYYTKIKINRGDAQSDGFNGYNITRFNTEATIFNSVKDLELSNKYNLIL